MLESLPGIMPDVSVFVYEELTEDTSFPGNVTPYKVCEVDEFKQVFQKHRDIIPAAMGGEASNLQGFQKRWFGWFRKIVTQYDLLMRHPFDGYTIFIDTDIRFLEPLTTTFVEEQVKKPVGVFKGNRDAIEAGLIIYAPVAEATTFVGHYMDWFLSGRFRELQRWDDGFVMAQCMHEHPDLVQDLAQGIVASTFKNTNGHETGGQVIPQTPFGRIVEHDKGIHWRMGAAEKPTFDKPQGFWGRLLSSLLPRP